MGLRAVIPRHLSEERALELCAAAMTSASPPLTPEARRVVDEIRIARLEELLGPELCQARILFDAIDTIPPFEAPALQRFLRALVGTDFSEDAFAQAIKSLGLGA